VHPGAKAGWSLPLTLSSMSYTLRHQRTGSFPLVRRRKKEASAEGICARHNARVGRKKKWPGGSVLNKRIRSTDRQRAGDLKKVGTALSGRYESPEDNGKNTTDKIKRGILKRPL